MRPFVAAGESMPLLYFRRLWADLYPLNSTKSYDQQMSSLYEYELRLVPRRIGFGIVYTLDGLRACYD